MYSIDYTVFVNELILEFMKTLKKIILKEERNHKIMNDHEMRLIMGGNVFWSPVCKTTCNLGNGNYKEISIKGATSCYVDEGVSVTKALCAGVEDMNEVCVVRCSDLF